MRLALAVLPGAPPRRSGCGRREARGAFDEAFGQAAAARLRWARSSIEPDAGPDAVAALVTDDADVAGRQACENERGALDVGLEVLLVEQVVDESADLNPADAIGERAVRKDIGLQLAQFRLSGNFGSLLTNAGGDSAALSNQARVEDQVALADWNDVVAV